MYTTLEKAEEFYNSQNYAEAFSTFLSEADRGNAYAQYRIGLMYESGEGTKKKPRTAFKYVKLSADAGHVNAISQLGYYYSVGLGCKKNPYEAAQCFKQAGDAGDALALDNYGVTLLSGEGVKRSISSAHRAFKQSADLGEERGKEHLKQLDDYYVFDSEGKIDLSAAKNSKIAMFITILLLIYNIYSASLSLLACIVGEYDSFIFHVALSVVYILAVFLLLLKQKMGGYLLYTLMAIPFIAFPVLIAFYTSSLTLEALEVLGGYGMFLSTIWFSSVLTYLILQKKRNGIPTWNRLIKRPFDGDRQIKEWMHGLIQYGNTPSYRVDAPETKRFRIIYLLLVSGMAICSGLCSYAIITTDGTLDLNLNWNFFTSSFAVPLCIVGFFLGLKMKTSSYTTYNVYKDPYTGDVKGGKKSDDIVDVVEGQILMPLLQRFLIIPLMVGAMIYYLVLICISIFGLMFPYLLSALIVFSIFFLYKRYHLFSGRKYRIALSMGSCLLLLCAYAIAYQCWKDELTPSISVMETAVQTTTGEEAIDYTPTAEEIAASERDALSEQEAARHAKIYDESPYYDQELVLTAKGIGSFKFDTYSYADIPSSFEGLYTRFERGEHVNEHDGINGVYKFYDNDTIVMQHYVYELGDGKINSLEVFSPKIGTALGLRAGMSAKELLNYEVTFEDNGPMDIVFVGYYQICVKGFRDSYAEKFGKWYSGEISQLRLDASDFEEGAVIESISH